MRYLVGLIGFPLGIIIVAYRERVKNFTGDMAFAEKMVRAGRHLYRGSDFWAFGFNRLVDVHAWSFSVLIGRDFGSDSRFSGISPKSVN